MAKVAAQIDVELPTLGSGTGGQSAASKNSLEMLAPTFNTVLGYVYYTTLALHCTAHWHKMARFVT